MIPLTDTSGRETFLAPGAIASIEEASASGRWHGICAYVRTFDGRTLEVRETAGAIAKLIEAAA